MATNDYGNPSSVSVLLNNGNGTFASQVSYPAGGQAYSVAVGDFDGDGVLDLATANDGQGNNTVSVLKNAGNGTFGSPVTYVVGSNPARVVVGDFNEDGYLDIAVANSGSGNVSILLNTGNGTFASQATYAVGTGPDDIAVADFNDDGYPDLAVANESSNTVSVLMNQGNGTFASQVTYGAGSASGWLAVGDFNGDGYPDLAVANATNGAGGNTISILLNNGNGTFAGQVTYAAGPNPTAVVVGDFNGDGIPDLAVSNGAQGSGSSSVGVLLGQGNGTFAAQVTYPAGSTPFSVVTADFTGDGVPDLAVANYQPSGSVSVLLGVCTLCPSGQTYCSGTCVDPQTDNANCGSCGLACSATAPSTTPGCSGGECVVTLASGQNSPNYIAVDGASVYWTNYYGGSVTKVPLGGGNVSTLASGLGPTPWGIAVDSTNVYWANAGVGTGTVMTVLTGGGNVTTLASGQANPNTIAVNSTGVYVAEIASPPSTPNGSIVAVPLYTVGATTLVSGQFYGPSDIAADAAHVYWTNSGDTSNGGSVMKMLLDGGSVTTLASGLNGAGGIAVDSTSVYWTGSSTVEKVLLDGGIPITLASGLNGPGSIAVDSTAVYWVNSGTQDAGYTDGTVMSVPTGGGTPSTLATGQHWPRGGIAIDSTSVYWTDWNSGNVMKVTPR